MNVESIPVRASAAPPLQASKWLKCPVLMDMDEMQALFTVLGDFGIFMTSSVLSNQEGLLDPQVFLNKYNDYIEDLKQGKLPIEGEIRPFFTSSFSIDPKALYFVPLSSSQRLLKIQQPVIQLQHHKFDYSPLDGKFRSMVLGPSSIFWGIQFSYPQLYQDPSTFQVQQVAEGDAFPNTALFRALQRWVRHHTAATPFLVQGKRTNVPIRLGKKCFEWINKHPQLKQKGIQVQVL
jgi:hypothetical protein